MNWLHYFNTTIGSCLIIALIAIDYLRKYNTDNFQRKLLIIMLSSIFAASVFDYLGQTIERNPGERINNVLYYIWSIYLIARNCSFYYGAAFIDYFAHGNAARTRKFLKIVTIFMFLYSISIVPNFQLGYYFYISRENIYVPGSHYMLQVFLSYLPIIIIMIDISLAPKHIKRPQVLLTIVFIILSAIGAALDIILRTTNLIWPCITAALLYMYFFIIRSDSKTDSLTGLGNRSSFNEYVKNISNESVEKEYAFIMVNLDRFKEINDKLGHTEGDNALRDIGLILKSCIRHTDFAARLGGDEFILATAAGNDVEVIIDRINNAIENQNTKNIRPYQLYISYSYDVYTGNSGWRIQDFLSRIESEMYKNKEIKRDKLPSVITANLSELI